MNIRLLKKKEIAQAASIVGKNYSKKYERLAVLELKEMFKMGAGKPSYFVAEEQGKIIGFAGFIQSWMDYNIYQIFWVNVLPQKQNQGTGKKLVAKIIGQIKKHKNAALIQLSTKVPKYYQKHFGFKTLKIFGKNKDHLMLLVLEKCNV